MLLLIQFDVCASLIDAVNHQVEVVESPMAEEETSDEIYYRTGKSFQAKAKYLTNNDFCILWSMFVPSVSLQGNEPVPKYSGKAIQQHIVYCVYRI